MHPEVSAQIAWPQHGLYAITDGPRVDLIASCDAVLRSGAVLLQYRDKTAEHARRRAEATALAVLCARHRVPLIVNDDIELAAEVDAAGVHLGEDDDDIPAARRRLGDAAIIGASCYDSLARARQLATAGVSYLAFGAFYPSPTKPDARRATPELLRDAKSLHLPLVAIGGITPENGRDLISAGADFLAVISGLFAATDPAAAAQHYAALFTK